MLTNEWWMNASDGEAAERCRAVARSLDLTFDRLAKRRYAGRTFRTAFFRDGDDSFALVPGGRFTLGFDVDAFRPSQEILESYAGSAEEYGLGNLREFLARQITPVRQVTLQPFLIEVSATSVDAETVEELAEQIAPYRLPTSDEWELACGAGARTLFRWGDDCPMDVYPVDRGDFDLHRIPNLYGLDIARNPYDTEVVADDAYRGGDGGSMICGGAGFFLGWLALASSYQLPEEMAEPFDEDLSLTFYRRLRVIEE